MQRSSMSNLLLRLEYLSGLIGRKKKYSVEFTITGRNDSYEPNWNQRLESVLLYNRSLCTSFGIDFRAAFVEWNPPKDVPLLSPDLVKKFDFLRAIVVSPQVHDKLCQSPDMPMMLNFSVNSAIRTSDCDFILVSGGDVFLGRNVVEYMKRQGLRRNYLYRAIRVDISSDLDFAFPRSDVLEDSRNTIRINETSTPPYTNACGDFILIDRTSFQNITGFDETIRHARLHLDSRCCFTAISYGLHCKMIGHVYHIDHNQSHVNALRRGFQNLQSYDYMANIPYRNPKNWGLQDWKWTKWQDRLYYIS